MTRKFGHDFEASVCGLHLCKSGVRCSVLCVSLNTSNLRIHCHVPTLWLL